MKKAGRYTGISLLMLLGYILFGVLVSQGDLSGGALAMGTLALIHTGIGVLAALVAFLRKDSESGKALLLSSLVVLVIGFSLCLGGISMGGLNFH